jgi:hypothetical protein
MDETTGFDSNAYGKTGSPTYRRLLVRSLDY